jgi:Cytochrome P450
MERKMTIPLGWLCIGDCPQDYEIGVKENYGINGDNSAFIKAKTNSSRGYGSLMQQLQPELYLNERVRLTGYLKTNNVRGKAALWMQISAPRGQILGFDNMGDRFLVGTNDWRMYEIVLDVPQASSGIHFGATLNGTGEFYVCSLRLEVVSSDVQTTDEYHKNHVKGYPQVPTNLSFHIKQELPDGPKGLSLLNTFRWFASPLGFLDECAQLYGDIFTVFQKENAPADVFVSNPQAIQKIYTSDPDLFDSGVGNNFLQPLLGNYSLILQDGGQHRHRRRIMYPHFHGERLQLYSH